MFLNPVLRRKLLQKQKLNNHINDNPLIPKHQEERFTLQSDYEYNEEYKKIVILDKVQIQDRLSSSDEESDNESVNEEIIEIPEQIKDDIQDDIKEITIDLESLQPQETDDTIVDEIDDGEDKGTSEDKDKEISNHEEKDKEISNHEEQEEGGGDKNLKNIVVYTFF